MDGVGIPNGPLKLGKAWTPSSDLAVTLSAGRSAPLGEEVVHFYMIDRNMTF